MICGWQESPTMTRSSWALKLSAMWGFFSVVAALCPRQFSPTAASEPNRPSPTTSTSFWYKRFLATNPPWSVQVNPVVGLGDLPVPCHYANTGARGLGREFHEL